ncbi:MAG TPA: hypothetical protein VGL86_14470 [Polyangia bacterium]|jgi:hypothetical protein
MRAVALALPIVLAGCGGPPLTVLAGADSFAAATAFAAFVPGGAVTVEASADPAGAVAHGGGARAALVIDLSCGDCFEIDARGAGAFVIHGGSILGVQYGLAQLLEAGGFRFYHPRDTLAPSTLALPASSPYYGTQVTPQKTLRGLHVHTLHPIEPYFALWVPSPDNLDGAKHIIDWLVKNRGNYLDWTALDNIVGDAGVAAAWHDHTKAILDYAHARGIRVGIQVELFHSGNLQNAYDLLTDADLAGGNDTHPLLQAKLSALLGDLPFDQLALNFGEFFGEPPDVFIQQINNTYDALQTLRPGMPMAAQIHVGNEPSQHVQYMGMDILYYFLVQYANPAVESWVHTVMYYDLFEDAGGAYDHQDFSVYRQYILDKLQQHQRVAYYPETAYWVAFDDSVPTYLPIYMLTRALDMTELDQQSTAMGGDPLTEHVSFSTGWEWGYWQNDYVTLRNTFQTPATWQAPIDEMLAPYGENGVALAQQIEALAMVQHAALIGHRLAPYMAGNDFLLDSGYASGIVSQPHRPQFSDVAAMSAADRASYEATVLDPLDQLADDTAAIFQAVDAIPFARDERWYREMHDGFAVDADRTRFIASLYRAAAVQADGSGPIDALLAAADAALADAKTIVAGRHAHLHDPSPQRLLIEEDNDTVYKYGYLNEADTLCYWIREREEFDAQLLDGSDQPPGCAIGF